MIEQCVHGKVMDISISLLSLAIKKMDVITMSGRTSTMITIYTTLGPISISDTVELREKLMYMLNMSLENIILITIMF